MAVPKKAESQKRKPARSGFKFFLIIIFVGLVGFFVGIYRTQVQEIYQEKSPAVVEGAKEGVDVVKRGLDWFVPRYNQFWDNIGKDIDAFVDKMTSSHSIPPENTKK